METEEGKKVGLGLPAAPVYHPSEEQFLNPLEFIASIRPEAENYGICRIVPPPSFKPPFMVDTERFTFDTRIQCVSELQHKLSSKPEYKAWNAKYMDFLKVHGKEKRRNPTFNGREIDLYKFHKIVEKRGGYTACCEEKQWREVARLLGVRFHVEVHLREVLDLLGHERAGPVPL
jgi:[histone H3]-trimethyl-L-lysine4 demethylase